MRDFLDEEFPIMGNQPHPKTGGASCVVIAHIRNSNGKLYPPDRGQSIVAPDNLSRGGLHLCPLHRQCPREGERANLFELRIPLQSRKVTVIYGFGRALLAFRVPRQMAIS